MTSSDVAVPQLSPRGPASSYAKRSKQLNLRVTEGEFEQLRVVSKLMGLAVAETIRTLVAQAYKNLGSDATEYVDKTKKARKRVLK